MSMHSVQSGLGEDNLISLVQAFLRAQCALPLGKRAWCIQGLVYPAFGNYYIFMEFCILPYIFCILVVCIRHEYRVESIYDLWSKGASSLQLAAAKGVYKGQDVFSACPLAMARACATKPCHF